MKGPHQLPRNHVIRADVAEACEVRLPRVGTQQNQVPEDTPRRIGLDPVDGLRIAAQSCRRSTNPFFPNVRIDLPVRASIS